MIVLGLDIATTTGWALYEPGSALATIRTGTIESAGDHEEKAAILGPQLASLLRTSHPDLVAVEAPLRNIKTFRKRGVDLLGAYEEHTINPRQMQVLGLSYAAIAIVAAHRIAWVAIASSTWRKQFLGVGTRRGWDRAAWKNAAIERCCMLRIEVKNSDAAEAVGVAIAGAASQAFRMLKAGQVAA